jgi:hypothetical protein
LARGYADVLFSENLNEKKKKNITEKIHFDLSEKNSNNSFHFVGSSV